MNRYELRDPIHKRVPFDEFERVIIDHPYFQRLRFISQLSFVLSYVYPGGIHNRFTHALGAMHVAGRLFSRMVIGSRMLTDRLASNEIEALRRRVRCAALLHDIGHGPFSHASEAVFPKVENLQIKREWWRERQERQAKHEDYSVLLISELANQGVLDQDFAQDICSLIHSQILPSATFLGFEQKAPTLHAVLKSIISGEVDCDRMDYLLRDGYYCGVAYGQFDLDWLISSMGITEQNGRMIYVIQENGVRAYEDMLLARYHMIDQVYFHKTKAGFTHYLEQAIKTREILLQIPTSAAEYANLRDATVMEQLFEAAKIPANYFSHHIVNRLPPKRILRLHDINPDDRKKLMYLEELCQNEGIRYFKHDAANELSGYSKDPSQIMIHVEKKTIGGYEYVPIGDYSDLLQKYNEKIRFTDFFVLREDFERFQGLINRR